MTKGERVAKSWLKNQDEGKYQSFEESMAGLIALIDAVSVSSVNPPSREEELRYSYREEQARLRAAGFDAYNCDMVDEFPRW